MWLPDTNAWIGLINARPSPVKAHFQSHSPGDIFLCDVVKAELYYGAFRSARRDDNLAHPSARMICRLPPSHWRTVSLW